jgi:hypothetical protein
MHHTINTMPNLNTKGGGLNMYVTGALTYSVHE